ncbi:hypothetical protein EHQ58_13535 [Leptospira ognonensis]|uniref:Uncharacterized protein n=1 Tax=Leptospira ognonensis TaxID=2484945 RepID=A0A4R9JWE9_9LEPT|nr:hypothetical protein [Leptospira ognonensis]TGL57313.1 hypothetical protein EHQ58_13535 [Leptospira ognonensis]
METAPYHYTSSDLNLTDYHIRKLVQAFYGVGARFGYLFLGSEHVFTIGKSEKEEHFLSQIQENLSTLEESTKTYHPLRIANWTESGEELQAVLVRIPHKEIFLFSVSIQKMGEEFPKSRWNLLAQAATTYLSIGISNRAKTLLSFRSFTEVFRRKVCEALSGFDSGVLALFYLQDLSPFFRPLGIVKSQEILREVASTLQSAIKPGELFFQLNVRSFYLFSPGDTVSKVNERMEGLYFPSKHMILDYKLKLYQVPKGEAEDPNLFSDLFMENL